MGSFDLITVRIGSKEIEARPSEFEMDGQGNVLRPLVYRTTCPHCSQLTTFRVEEPLNGHIFCQECGVGRAEWQGAVQSAPTSPAMEAVLAAAFSGIGEPIASGLMEHP